MKVYILSLGLLLSLFAQEEQVEIKEIKDKLTVDLIGSLKSPNTYSTDQFFLSIFEKENPYGSANNESGEITHSYYFVISDVDEFPKRTLFELGTFYAPEISNVKTFEKYIGVEITYYDDGKKVSKIFKVSHHRITK